MKKYLTLLFLLIFINLTGQVSFSVKSIISGQVCSLIPIVDFQYDSVKYEPDIGIVTKVQSMTAIYKNGNKTIDKSTLNNWKICDVNVSDMTLLISCFYRNDSIIAIDTSIFKILPYPTKKFSLAISTNISELKNNKSFFDPDTTWKSVYKQEGELLKRINAVIMKNHNFMDETNYIVKGFTLSIHKGNGKLIKEISIIGDFISDEINRELKKYNNRYLTLTNVNAELECGLKIDAVSDEKIFLKFAK